MTSSRHAQTTEKKALLIGIEYIGSQDKDAQPLIGIKNDLDRVKDSLITHWNYNESNIVIMTDSAAEHLKPTKENILREMRNLVADARPGDKRFFVFAGHSFQIKDINFDEADGLDEAIVPLDHCGLSGKAGTTLDPENDDDKKKVNAVICDDDMRKILVDSLQRGVKLFALFDSCTSGTLLDLKHYCRSKPVLSKPLKVAGSSKRPKRRATCIADGTDWERPRRQDTFPLPTRRSSVDWRLHQGVRLCSSAQFDEVAPKTVVSFACTEDSQTAITFPGVSLIPVFVGLAEEPETRKCTWKQVFKMLHYRMRGIRLVAIAKHFKSLNPTRRLNGRTFSTITDMYEPQIGADSRSTLHEYFGL